jgi:hypothetical protein
MPQVKYIGSSVKTDSISGIGLRWEPGQVRNVTSEVAERLLAFTDTWVREQAGKAPDVEPVGLAEAEKPVEEPLPVIDFHAMDKTALVEFAEDKYNERLDKRLSEETIRHKVITLFTKHEMAD